MVFRKKRKDPFKEIQACLQKRDYKSALDWFNTLLQKDAKNTQIRLRFADTLVLAGSKKEAVKQYRVVADELAEKGFMIRAIAINKKILQLDPKQTDVHAKLAEMNQERSASASRPALGEALRRPDAAEPRPSEPAAVTPPAEEPRPAKGGSPPQVLPELSLEESMAMEFGDTGEIAAPEPPPAEESQPPPPGGFELIDDSSPATTREPETLPEEPSFSEEPIELGGSVEPEIADDSDVITIDADDEEADEAVELALDDIDEPPSSPEIVLEIEPPPDTEPDVIELSADASEPEPVEASADEPDIIVAGEEMEVVEFQMEDEPEMAADESAALVGALGEDIDSLIDSIIDDVGTSAQRAQVTQDEPPTHIPLFSDLTTPEFIDVAILLVRRVLKVGEIAVKEGDPGDSMFIISTGEVRATVNRDGRQVPVATLRDGDFFGEMAVLSGEPRSATVTAVKHTEILELSRENLREICSRHPHVEAKIRLAYDERVASDQTRR